jgi:hypothetical protein
MTGTGQNWPVTGAESLMTGLGAFIGRAERQTRSKAS